MKIINKLKTCPFCNSNKAKIYTEGNECFYIQCKCGICTVACETEEKAINIWNNRIDWHKSSNYPEEDKYIIVQDNKGKEYDNHTWNGHSYYDRILDEDGGDGYPTDIDVVKWRYQ